jgi:septal ring-binding cell division protein DamX
VSTMETPPPPPETSLPPAPPERRCPRCGSTLAPDQEWCLACGAAADTEVVEARGWRVPLYLGGGLAALAVLGVILAIVALASRNDEVKPTATPVASAAPPGATPAAPLATQTPLPSATASPDPNATVSPDPNATASPDPNATASPDPSATETPEATPTTDPNTDSGSGSTFPDWSGTDGWTVIIESSKTQEGAETVATKAESDGLSGVGILQSSDYSSLNGGYHVVFVGEYTSKSDAEAALPDAKAKFSGAYVRKVSN